jgi:Holliday junction resolvase-like predicted endonuclease
MKRSSAQKGAELEKRVEEFLLQRGYKPIHNKIVLGLCGAWELDIYLDTTPPVVIECKNPTSEARNPHDSVRRKAQEAFLLLYDLKNYSSLKEAVFVLITGKLELRFANHDFEGFLKKTLGSNFHIIKSSEIEKLTSHS